MNWMGNLQHFGRALMLPMIALPAASIFLSLANLPWDSLGFGALKKYYACWQYDIHFITDHLRYWCCSGINRECGNGRHVVLTSLLYMYTDYTKLLKQ